MATATASGEPLVGQTLTCSEPVITGGIGPYQRDYSWTDDSNAIIFESRYMGPTFVLTADDVGKSWKCLVQCTDKGWSGGESIAVASNVVGPVRPPAIGEFTVKVNGARYDYAAGAPIETTTGASYLVLIERNGDSGVTYNWSARQGQASLTPNDFPSSGSCAVEIESVAPQSVQIQCDMIQKDATDNPKSVLIPFFVTG